MRTLAFLLFALLSSSVRVEAQQETDDVRAAARAFEQGQRAQLQGEYARAAELFEIAFRAAPAPAAIRAAIRNHQAAGELPRAATLSQIAASTYPSDTETIELTGRVLAEADASLGRLDVRCAAPCAVAVNGQLATTRDVERLLVYVQPGAHRVAASFDGSEATEDVTVEAGAVQAVQLAPSETPREETGPPAPDVVPPSVVAPAALGTDQGPATEPTSRGISPAWTYVGAGITVALGGTLVWSLVDVGNASDDYKANPTREGFEDGQDRVRRTAVLGAAVGACAIATVLIASLATDWGGDEDVAETLPSVWMDENGGGLAISGPIGRFE
ncbi:MAG: hypothetical protein AAF645_25130 [Myxococcota bacterium]